MMECPVQIIMSCGPPWMVKQHVSPHCSPQALVHCIGRDSLRHQRSWGSKRNEITRNLPNKRSGDRQGCTPIPTYPLMGNSYINPIYYVGPWKWVIIYPQEIPWKNTVIFLCDSKFGWKKSPPTSQVLQRNPVEGPEVLAAICSKSPAICLAGTKMVASKNACRISCCWDSRMFNNKETGIWMILFLKIFLFIFYGVFHCFFYKTLSLYSLFI